MIQMPFNPVSSSFLALIAVSLVAIAIFGSVNVTDFMDAIVITGGILCLLRFGLHALRGLRRKEPAAEDKLVIGIFGAAIYISFARILRQVAVELDVKVTDISFGIPFALLTAIMAWAMLLLVIAPPFRNSKPSVISTPIIVSISLVAGISIYVLMKFIRYIF